jgi:uncharacterized protein YdaU (DUF1376 family)
MSMSWFPFYHADYLADTSRLSPSQHGVYLLLLLSFFKDGPLPNDPDTLCRIAAGATPSDVHAILERYWVLTDAGWVNPKMDEVRSKAIEGSRRYGDRARIAAQARWSATSNAISIAPSNAPSNAEPRTQNSEPRTKRERATFVAPSPTEVAEYAKEAGLRLDAQAFVDFYASKGWVVGKAPMRDWKAAVRNWAKRDRVSPVTKREVFS